MSNDKATLFKKMSNVMAQLDRIEKRGHNTFFNYDFVTSDDVLQAVRKAMAKEGLAFFVNMLCSEIVETGGMDKSGNPKKKHVTDFEFNIADGETGEVLTCIWKGEALDNEDKALSKCATSAEKYFLLKTFLIGTGDEPDPDESDDTGKKSAVKKPESHKPSADITKDLAHLSGIVDSEGKAYLMMTKEELSNRSIGIGKALTKNGLTTEKKAEYETKQAAIKEILEWLANH